MSLEIEPNPFQPPAECETTPADYSAPIYFGGSMSEDEGGELYQLFKGQKAKRVSVAQLVWIGVAAFLVVGFFAAEAVFYEEPEELLNVGLGVVVIVVTFAAVAYQQQREKRLMSRLKSERKGVFTNLAGRVNDQGIEYLILLKLGKKEAAIADLETAIRLDASFERPRVLLAEAMSLEVAAPCCN